MYETRKENPERSIEKHMCIHKIIRVKKRFEENRRTEIIKTCSSSEVHANQHRNLVLSKPKKREQRSQEKKHRERYPKVRRERKKV